MAISVGSLAPIIVGEQNHHLCLDSLFHQQNIITFCSLSSQLYQVLENVCVQKADQYNLANQ